MELLILMLLLSGFKGGALKPGMTALVSTPVGDIGFVVINQGGKVGWTNVLPAKNATVRQLMPNGTRVLLKSGTRKFHAVSDGDGIQGGKFLRPV